MSSTPCDDTRPEDNRSRPRRFDCVAPRVRNVVVQKPSGASQPFRINYFHRGRQAPRPHFTKVVPPASTGRLRGCRQRYKRVRRKATAVGDSTKGMPFALGHRVDAGTGQRPFSRLKVRRRNGGGRSGLKLGSDGRTGLRSTLVAPNSISGFFNVI